MSNISQDEVKHIAKLANLDLTDSEIKKFAPQLSKIVEYVSELSEVDTKDTKPTNQTTGLVDVMREDIVSIDEVLSQDEALSGTDTIHNGHFKVKAILTERSDK